MAGGEDFGGGLGAQDGVFRFAAGDGRVPGDCLVGLNDALVAWDDAIVAGFVAGGAALVVELPFVGEAECFVGFDSGVEGGAGGSAGARAEDECGVDVADGFVLLAQVGRYFAEVGEPRHAGYQAPTPAAQHYHHVLLDLLLGWQRMAIMEGAVVGGDQYDGGRDADSQRFVCKACGYFEFGVVLFDGGADALENERAVAAEPAVSVDLFVDQRVSQRVEIAVEADGAAEAGVGGDGVGADQVADDAVAAGFVEPWIVAHFDVQLAEFFVAQARSFDVVGDYYYGIACDVGGGGADFGCQAHAVLAAAGYPREVVLPGQEDAVQALGVEVAVDPAAFLLELVLLAHCSLSGCWLSFSGMQ